MPLIDRSPGAFIVLANTVVYGVVGAEIWMWTASSAAAVAVTLALIAVCAGCICFATLRLMEDGVTPVEATDVADEPVVQEAAPVLPRPTVRRVGPAHPA